MVDWNGEERRSQCILHSELLHRLEKKLDEIHNAIFGNGKMENGLQYKVSKNTDFRQLISKIWWAFVLSFLTVPASLIIIILTVQS